MTHHEAGKPIVELVNLRKSFHGNVVLKDITMSFYEGQVSVLLGQSGSGKTTLLRCINGLETPNSGLVFVDGELIDFEVQGETLIRRKPFDVARRTADVGMVFQSFNLFDNLTVGHNIMLGPRLVRKEKKDVSADEAKTLLERVGLSDKFDSYPYELSGGQQQRVAIARALAMKPKVLLFDEPTSALDRKLVDEVLDVMRDLANQGMTMIVVTHELEFARSVADDVTFMQDGNIVERGTAEQVMVHPKSQEAQAFFEGFQ